MKATIPTLIFALSLTALADKIKYSQLIPPGANAIPTTSSSYDYWWPYPPGDVISATTTPAPATCHQIKPFRASDIVSISLLSSSSDDTNSTTRSDNSSSSTFATPTSSVSIIIASAPSCFQSPLPSLVGYPKKEPSESKIRIYLIPVLVVVGAILGSLCAWIGWGRFRRKGRRGKTELE
ncbi:uncharacterized protein BT62DRAFT_626625 [Guyanagaster necrorhizus]|uniref:Uncharacterized protein n=1 Tax=Guyanagaster necrorhizus TaxID=856835 RepID=A0A9P7VI10_9AGAR|nr:uncharacterized protein BT62DRAFT_626625 [Guyanagaster necrorhizus MCA 3950]KAG7440411.1 hypothetical protein BT62DRAFT_626625 [Guyanagaster necrorhizus MCA 3950]